MRIVFHGENAASFSNEFDRLIGATADIRILPDQLTSAADRDVYAAADAIVGVRFSQELPRPEVLQEVLLYTEEEKRLLEVRPGITDWASIRFRNEGEILRGSADPHAAYREKIRPEKIRLGLEYVERRSFLTDCKIIVRTLKAILE